MLINFSEGCLGKIKQSNIAMENISVFLSYINIKFSYPFEKVYTYAVLILQSKLRRAKVLRAVEQFSETRKT